MTRGRRRLQKEEELGRNGEKMELLTRFMKKSMVGKEKREDECLEISVVGDQLGWSTSPQVPGLSSEQASARGRKEGKEAYHEILPCKESIAHHKASPIADAQV